ncbi:MAG: hypothetical protein D6E12_09360 [Desulfovibrio sp.]|nr:MAG: hypothetical protein D6E12_09360 [Desulfovibrio sp.]
MTSSRTKQRFVPGKRFTVYFMACLVVALCAYVTYLCMLGIPEPWARAEPCMTYGEFIELCGEPNARHHKDGDPLWRWGHLLGWYEMGIDLTSDQRIRMVSISCYFGWESFHWKKWMSSKALPLRFSTPSE